MKVGTWAEAVDSLLLSATTYSFWCFRSIRDIAKTPCPVEANRTCSAPLRSAGCASVTAASPLMVWYSGASVTKLSWAWVRSVPIRSSSRYSGTWLANIVCRASWSPPLPVKPCSSP